MSKTIDFLKEFIDFLPGILVIFRHDLGQNLLLRTYGTRAGVRMTVVLDKLPQTSNPGDFLANCPHCNLQLRLHQGDVALMDSRLIHRGGLRAKSKRTDLPFHRVLFYIHPKGG